MNETELINYYNKFNEDKRLNTKHGNIEFITGMKYIRMYLDKIDNPKVLDVGAGTGKYSIALKNAGYDVTALELVKHNLKVINEKDSSIKTYLGNAIDLSKFKDDSFDGVLLFGPMYHLISLEDKLKALVEARRVVKNSGYIFISYCMNEYAFITYGIKENHLKEVYQNNMVDDNFHIKSNPKDLYSFVRMNDIDYLKDKAYLKRVKILSQDGPSEYLKKEINKMDEKTYNLYIKYHLATCEDKYLLNAGRHVLDILQK